MPEHMSEGIVSDDIAPRITVGPLVRDDLAVALEREEAAIARRQERILNGRAKALAGTALQVLQPSFASQNVFEPYYSPEYLASYVRLSGVLRSCLEVRARVAVAAGPVRIKPIKEQGRARREDKQRIEAWLRRWKPSFVTVLERMFFDRLASHGGFLELIPSRDGQNIVAEVRHLPSDFIRQVKPSMDGQDRWDTRDLDYPRWAYSRGLRRLYFRMFGDPWDVDRQTGARDSVRTSANMIHWLSDTCFLDRVYGTPPWATEQVFRAVLTNVEIARFDHEQFRGNCIPDYIITFLGTRQSAAKIQRELDRKLREIKMRRAAGDDHRKIITLCVPPPRVGSSASQITMQIDPLQPGDPEGRNFKVLDRNDIAIAMSLGVPPRLINLIATSMLGGKEDAEGQIQQFIDFTVRPDQRRIEQEILLPLIREGLGIEGWEIELGVPTTAEIAAIAGAYEKVDALKSWTLDEKREFSGRISLAELMDSLDDDDHLGAALVLLPGDTIISLEDLERQIEQGETSDIEAALSKLDVTPTTLQSTILPALRERLAAYVRERRGGE